MSAPQPQSQSSRGRRETGKGGATSPIGDRTRNTQNNFPTPPPPSQDSHNNYTPKTTKAFEPNQMDTRKVFIKKILACTVIQQQEIREKS
jgi:hypothetical protein